MDQNYTTSITVDQSPEEAFAAINNVRGWWSQAIEGDTDKLGAEFKYRAADKHRATFEDTSELKYQTGDLHRATFKITEFVPNKKVVWHVLDNYFNFVQDTREWVGTDVVFEIGRKDDKTQVTFTHVGLVPEHECYGVCSDAWGSYITGSLRDLITTGKGQPNPAEEMVSNTGR